MSKHSIISHSVNFQPGLVIVNFPYSYVTRLKVSIGSDMIFSEDLEECALEESETDRNKKELNLNIKYEEQNTTNQGNPRAKQFFLHTTGTFFRSIIEINGKFCQLVFSHYTPFESELSNTSSISSYGSSKTYKSSTEECKSETGPFNPSLDLLTNSDPNTGHTSSVSESIGASETQRRRGNSTRESFPNKKRTQIQIKEADKTLNIGEIKDKDTEQKCTIVNEKDSHVPIDLFTHDLNILVYGSHLSQEEKIFREHVQKLISEKKYQETEKLILDWYMGDQVPSTSEKNRDSFYGCDPSILRAVLDIEGSDCPKTKIHKEVPKEQTYHNEKLAKFETSTFMGSCSIALLSFYLFIFLETCDLSFIEQLYDYLEMKEYQKVICAAMTGIKKEITLP